MGFPAAWMVAAVLVVGQHAVGGVKEMGPKTQLPDDTLFKDPAAFCEGCYGMVHELHKLLLKWKKEKGSLEDHIDAALLAVCSTDRLRAYVLSPPKMVRLCSGIRAHYEDEAGLVMLKQYSAKKKPSVDKVFESFCKKTIPACPKGLKPMSVARKEKTEKAAEEKKAREEKENKEKGEEKTKQKTKTKNDTKKNKKDEL
ncbi:uncharacterized protein LOC121865404 [Homarus americanus]|uniref:Saposin B-type domain-containing protein n=1 Tax=Homarus americanus TaxID=6706 RepID=A0A8J5MZX7_HOMAM|nr:uncharacterized protein LOC121865404 [Homarus americanus]KAG7169626.1 hypothetical protein Hamer_G013225 [Homarus americanus]